VIPLYKEPLNSPFVPNIQKELANRDEFKKFPQQQHQQQQPPKTNQQYNKPLVDLQVYQPSKPNTQSIKNRDSNNLYMPIPTTHPYFPPQYNPYWPNFYAPQLPNPIIKQYSINNAPFLEYSSLKTGILKEDSLPSQFVNTSNTLGERINIYNFVRSIFIKNYDGEDIDIDGNGTNSLLRYLKFLELNPYNTHQNNNPYHGLPSDMLIYKSCYPVRYDEKTNAVQCAPNSLGMNIRIYKLTHAEYNIKKLEQQNFYDYNIWREIAYYEYIRENILKTKVCPNFIMIYGYYINEKCNVDFNKVAQLSGNKLVAPQQIIVKNQLPNSQLPQNAKIYGIPFAKIANPTSQYIDLNSFSGRGLVALTEAPTHNIYKWSSKIYTIDGNIHKMVNTGYHKSEIWMSVIFQLMSALYILQLHKISFDNFSLEDHVYIKDITHHDNVIMCWKYKINNFEYYVPNYGYLVLIDSNYKNIEFNQLTLIKKQNVKRFKIYSNIFKDGIYNDSDLDDKCFSSFQRAIDSNKFKNAFTNYGSVNPPADIINLLNQINNEILQPNSSKNISDYIYKYMASFLNNRIGTYLSELEIKNVRRDEVKKFVPGMIIVYEVQNETFKFVIFVKYNNNSTVKILTKNDPKDKDCIESDLEPSPLFLYSRTETILQTYKPSEFNLNEEEILETYVLNK